MKTIQSVSRLRISSFFRGGNNTTHIGSTRNYEVILKLDRFSHLSGRYFRLSFSTGLRHLSNDENNLNKSDEIGIVITHPKPIHVVIIHFKDIFKILEYRIRKKNHSIYNLSTCLNYFYKGKENKIFIIIF